MICDLTVSPTIAKCPVDRHNFGWSGVPSRPTASPGIHDYPLAGAHERTPCARCGSDESAGIARDRVCAPGSSCFRAISDCGRRRVVPHTLLQPQSIRCRQSAPSESASRPVRESVIHVFQNSLRACAGSVPPPESWSQYPGPASLFAQRCGNAHRPPA